MSFIGPLGGGTFVNDTSTGTVAITGPGNAILSDGVMATAVLLLGQISNYLKATNFGFNVPLDATINGILVEVQQQTTLLAAMVDSSVKIVQGGTILGSEKANSGNWPLLEAYQTYGGTTDLWGLLWSPSDINSSGFGIALSVSSLLAATADIDYIRATVYWTGSNRPGSAFGHEVKVGDGMSRSENSL